MDRRRPLLAALALCAVAGLAGPVLAAPVLPVPAVASDGLESLGLLPDQIGGVEGGMHVRGSRLVVSTRAALSVYDTTDPASPALVGRLSLDERTVPGSLEVTPDGRRALLSYFGYTAGSGEALAVYDLTNPAAIRETGRLTGFYERVTCLLRCTWAYGDRGAVVDLRSGRPRVAAASGTAGAWNRQLGLGDTRSGHLEEPRPGQLLLATSKGLFDERRLSLVSVDTRNPLRPRVLRSGAVPEERLAFAHAQWPRQGRDRVVVAQTLFSGEDLFCTSPGRLLTYTPAAAGTLRLTGSLGLRTGSYADGSPAANPLLSCGGGAFDTHPAFRDGGLVVTGQLEHGTRMVRISPDGKLAEVGYSLSAGGSVGQTTWASQRPGERVVYAADLTRGVEVLRWTGDV